MPDRNSIRADNNNLTEPPGATIIIPDMNFTCSDRAVRFVVPVPATIVRQPLRNPQLQIWRQSVDKNGVFHKVGKNIVLNSDVCVRLMREPLAKKWRSFGQARVFNCSLQVAQQEPVQRGDILGIQVPGMVDEFPLYFKESGPVNYIFLGETSGRVNLSNYNKEIVQQPLITLQVVPAPGLSIYKSYNLAGGRRIYKQLAQEHDLYSEYYCAYRLKFQAL